MSFSLTTKGLNVAPTNHDHASNETRRRNPAKTVKDTRNEQLTADSF
jgi:hypothetical protein